jgi:5-methylcytosine-specific restriction endonuclease McrA
MQASAIWKTMSNTYNISEKDEQEIRARDKTCVYCRILMKRGAGSSGATIEHFNNDGPFDEKYNVAICCRGCNSSKGAKELLAWFETDYCHKKKINDKTVSKPVKEYMRLKKLS